MGASLLIVDDDAMIASTLKDILREQYATAAIAHGYDEAIRLLEGQSRYDVAFIDLKLGNKLSGVDLARRAASLGIRVVAMTGYSTLPEGLDGVALLTKPFSVEAVRLVFSTVQNGPR